MNASDENGNTPLHLAAIYGRAEVARELLEAGAGVYITSLEGKTALELAEEYGEKEVGNVNRARHGHGVREALVGELNPLDSDEMAS